MRLNSCRPLWSVFLLLLIHNNHYVASNEEGFMFLFGLIVGLFVGANVGLIAFALMNINRNK